MHLACLYAKTEASFDTMTFNRLSALPDATAFCTDEFNCKRSVYVRCSLQYVASRKRAARRLDLIVTYNADVH